MTRALRLALGLFTIIPAGDPGEPDRTSVRWALLLAPLIGVLLGAISAGFLLAFGWVTASAGGDASVEPVLSALLAAVLTVALLQIITGGLHLDGLADSADGLAAGGDAGRTLAVMRDSSVGAAGALAVTLLLFTDVAALALAVAKGHGPQAVILAVVTGRLAVQWAVRPPAARPDGLGAWVAGTVGTPLALGSSVLWLVLLGGFVILLPAPAGSGLAFALAAVPAGVIVALAAVTPVRRRVGGITGDILGAVVETATAAALVVIALAP